jgi:hypothetical protein
VSVGRRQARLRSRPCSARRLVPEHSTKVVFHVLRIRTFSPARVCGSGMGAPSGACLPAPSLSSIVGRGRVLIAAAAWGRGSEESRSRRVEESERPTATASGTADERRWTRREADGSSPPGPLSARGGQVHGVVERGEGAWERGSVRAWERHGNGRGGRGGGERYAGSGSARVGAALPAAAEGAFQEADEAGVGGFPGSQGCQQYGHQAEAVRS